MATSTPTDDLVIPETESATVTPNSKYRWKVKLTHPDHNGRTVFSSVSEQRARNFVQNRYPRGSEAHLVSPDGVIEHYEKERTGTNGADAPRWASFDPSTWEPPTSGQGQATTGNDEWADREG